MTERLEGEEKYTADILYTLMMPYSNLRIKIRHHVVAMISYVFRVPEDEVQECINKTCRCFDICCYENEIKDLNLLLRTKTRSIKGDWFCEKWGGYNAAVWDEDTQSMKVEFCEEGT